MMHHSRVELIDYHDVVDHNYRGDLLGSLEQQKCRMNRLVFILKEMPKMPCPEPSRPFPTFHEIFEFEAGMRDL